jgi:GTP-binding nuclear protein Ran
METQKPQQDLSFKIVFAGASGVGKSCFLRRHRTGLFESRYIRALGCDLAALSFQTTRGLVTFKVWDLDGGNREGHFRGAQGLVAFYDLTRPETLQVALDIVATHQGLATVICGNKADIKPLGVVLRPSPNPDIPYFDTSARSNNDVENPLLALAREPFLALARRLTGDAKLEFIESPVLRAPGLSTIEKDLLVAFDEELTYTIGPQDGYASLRDDLESLLVEAGCWGYTVVVQVKASLKIV